MANTDQTRVNARHPKTGKNQAATLKEGVVRFADGTEQMQAKAHIVARYSAADQNAKLCDKYGNN